MQIELKITADSFAEIAHLFSVGTMLPPSGENVELPAFENRDGAKEVEPELPTKKSRGKKSATAETATPSSDTKTVDSVGPTATTPASPSDDPVTFEDLRTYASSLMDSGKVDGRAIQGMLEERFKVKAFGPLSEEQYPAAMEALRDLAA